MELHIPYTCHYCKKEAKLGEHRCERMPIRGKKTVHDSKDKKVTVSSILIYLFVIAIFALLAGSLFFIPGNIRIISIFLLIVMAIIVFGIKTMKANEEDESYRELVRLVDNDRAAADRLIKSELSRNSELNRIDGITRAYNKLLYDRTR